MAGLGDILAVAGLVLALSQSTTEQGEKQSAKKEKRSERRRKFLCALEVAKLGDNWARFFDQSVYRETIRSYNPYSHNKTPAEVAASLQAVNRNRDRLATLKWAPNAWAYGSKGLFQFLGPVICIEGGGWRFPKQHLDPDMAYRPGVAIAGAIDFANDLMNKATFTGTWASLNVGWGNPSNMNDAAKLAKATVGMDRRSAALGYQTGWGNEVIEFAPGERTADELWELAQAIDAAYERC